MSTPLRMCVVCRQMKEKGQLLKIVKNKDGEISYDPTGKMSGRGAYVCKEKACVDRLYKTKGFERALKSMIPEEVFAAVNEKIED